MAEGDSNIYSVWVAIIQLLGALAWPTALIVAICLFKKDLQRLLPLARFKYGDSEVSFRLEQAEEDAAALLAQRQRPEEPRTPEEIERFEKIAEISPRAAILEKRRALEEAVIKRVAEEPGQPSGKNLPMSAAVRTLRKLGKIDTHTSAILDDLIAVGNAAAHRADGFTKQEAERYQKLADQAISFLTYW